MLTSMTSIETERSSDQPRNYPQLSTTLEPAQRRALLETVARLRAFAILLSMDVGLADELVEVTLVRASVGISPSSLGVNLSTWLFSRLRSYYYREFARRSMPAGAQGPRPGQYPSGEHGDTLAALAKLPAEQREALVLIEAAGLSMGDAARICRRPPGRFKALVESARTNLARLLARQGSERLQQTAISFVLLTSAGRAA
jgi:RNA polymerase sigma-70 factor (ECF subfamily)